MTGVRATWPLIGRDTEMATLAAALDGSAAGVVVAGPPGVGRTRLAREAVDLARARGRPVHRAAASAAAAALPLGALAHLLPTAPSGAAEPELLERARRALTAGPGRPVLVVDDAHLLDPLSVTLVHRLVAAGDATLVATVPATGPDPTTTLWKDDLAARIDLRPLSRARSERLLAEVLDGAVDSRLTEQLWRLSHGNPRVLREFVEGGRESGRLHRVDGLWRWSGPMEPTPRLTGIVLAQLAGLAPHERAALDLLAVAGPLPVGRFVELAGRPTVAALERSGLITVRCGDVPGSAHAEPAYPVHAAVLADQLPEADAGRIRRQVVRDPGNPGAGSSDDLLRTGRMLLDGESVDVDAEVLARSAEEAAARSDHRLAERLARAALASGSTQRAAPTLVEALMWQGRAAEAEQVAAAARPASARLVAVRALNLQFGLRRPAEARGVLEPTVRHDRTGVLTGTLALLELRSGDVRRAVELGGRALASPACAAGHRLAAAAAGTGLAVQGRAAEALRIVTSGQDTEAAGPVLGALALEQAGLVALLHAGRIEDHTAAAAALHRASMAATESAGDAIGALHRGAAALAAGRVDTAARWLTEARLGLSHRDPLDLQPICTAWLATARALLGDSRAAEALLDDLDGAGPLVTPQRQRARVWVLASRQRVADAAALARDAAGPAGAAGQVVVAAGLLHDAVRLGHAADAAEPLRALARSCDAPIVRIAAEHADAAVAGDATRLDAAGDRFEELGALLSAADCAAAAAADHQRTGRRRLAATASARAVHLARRCGSPRTPALAGLEPPRLTAREHDIARLAASGLSNQRIARRLVVSVRTVETHLARTYTKLGICGRGELDGALGPGRGPAAR
ncbi:LuxR family transcriptional regulator [Pseudonocardia sp.]|uniref:helix-turn-helix transcriptional regulator n=1 Tax=Pseudonocardia sp. TaxID=60912 RepID=UPI002638A390|nr:LuxR family transcriptional regulator [Pseudonocardia sp.]